MAGHQAAPQGPAEATSTTRNDPVPTPTLHPKPRIPLHPHPVQLRLSEALCQEQQIETGIQRDAWQSLSLWDKTPNAGGDLEASAEAVATALEQGMGLMSLAGLPSSAVLPF